VAYLRVPQPIPPTIAPARRLVGGSVLLANGGSARPGPCTVPRPARWPGRDPLRPLWPISRYSSMGAIVASAPSPVLSVDGNYWAATCRWVPCPAAIALRWLRRKADPVRLLAAFFSDDIWLDSHLEIYDSAVWDGFIERLVDPFPPGARGLGSVACRNSGPGGCAERSTTPGFAAKSEPNRSGRAHELALQEQIWGTRTSDNGWARDLEADDGVEMGGHVPSSRGRGFADIVLVEPRDTDSDAPARLRFKRDAIPA